MIKINLALRKSATAGGAAAAAAVGGGGGGRFDISRMLKLDPEGIKGMFRELAGEETVRKFAGALGLAIAIYFGLGKYQDTELARLDGEIAVLQDTQAQIRRRVDELKGYEPLKKTLDADEILIRTKIETIQKLIADRQTPPKVLLSLSSVIPERVWIKDLAINPKQVSFKGNSYGFTEVTDFLSSLNQSAYFTDLNLANTAQASEEGVPVVAFELTAKRR